MACGRSSLRSIVMVATLLSTGTAAFGQWPWDGGIGAMKEQMQERAFVKAATLLLNDDLPIVLDATTALPTVDTLPGGAFKPRPLAVSADMLSKPLAPGDYVVNVTAFCTEYSVHRPGHGVAYKLAPLKGHAAQAVSTLLWRGMKAHVPERRLMSLSWAIQSGLSLSEMPATFKADFDRLIPDYEFDLSGDFLQDLENTYRRISRLGKLPPLEALLGKMGAPGKTVLTLKRQRTALMAQGQSDAVKEQTLFAGQESGVYTPVSAEEGPWTERIPGVAYMRFKIVGGHLASNNVMEIRIVGEGSSVAKAERAGRFVEASYAPGQGFGSMLTSPSLMSMLGAQQNLNGDITADGLIGYSQGEGAQALIPVLPPAPVAQFQLTKATTPDAQTVVVNYTVTTKLTSPIHFAVYRSPTQDSAPASNQIAQCDVPSSGGCVQNVAGSGDSDPLSVGDHTVTLNPSAGLPPNTAFPYVVVTGTSGTQQQTTYFRKFLVAAISHGFNRYNSYYFQFLPQFLQAGVPDWESAMAKSLVEKDHYDAAIPFDWTSSCAIEAPNLAVLAGTALALGVLEEMSIKNAHAGDVVDIHFIGHSRGTVVVTQAMKYLSTKDEHFGGGYVQVTLLDPHPANNCLAPKCLAGSGPLGSFEHASRTTLTPDGALARNWGRSFQQAAVDPAVTVPSGVKKAEVWFQHTEVACLSKRLTFNTGTYVDKTLIPESQANLWGQVDSSGLINQSGVPIISVPKTTVAGDDVCTTGLGIGHNEVPEVYEEQVIESGTLNRNTQWQAIGGSQ